MLAFLQVKDLLGSQLAGKATGDIVVQASYEEVGQVLGVTTACNKLRFHGANVLTEVITPSILPLAWPGSCSDPAQGPCGNMILGSKLRKAVPLV